MTNHFNICILGSGAVGQTVAYRGRKAGLSVAVLETQTPGGTCPNRGCDAKKPYVNAAGLMYRVGRLHEAGGGIAPTAITWRDIAAFKKSFTDPVGDLTAKDLRKAGVELIQGSPTFIDRDALEIGGWHAHGFLEHVPDLPPMFVPERRAIPHMSHSLSRRLRAVLLQADLASFLAAHLLVRLKSPTRRGPGDCAPLHGTLDG